MRLMITGASGLLGLNIAMDASSSHEVIGVDRNPVASRPFQTVAADLLEGEALGRILDETRAEAVIHCAAAADVDFCEEHPQLAWRTNAELPMRVAEACGRRGIALIHISTDAVFDGRSPGYYSEADAPNPSGVYATTKLEGERSVLRVNAEAIVVRVNFYGWSMSGTRSLAEFFVNNLSLARSVSGFTDVTFCPMLANDLGEILLKMVNANLHGLYHVVGPEAMTKYEFGVRLAGRFGLDPARIVPESVERSPLVARRSHNLRLSIHKLSTELGMGIPSFSTGLDRFYAQYQQGYPQKIRSFLHATARAGSNADLTHRI